jgi:hypothetical protein
MPENLPSTVCPALYNNNFETIFATAKSETDETGTKVDD